jgi:hypothetical protein
VPSRNQFQRSINTAAMMMTALVVAVNAHVVSAEQEPVPSTDFAGRAFEPAEALFHQDPAWLGTDGAISASLGDGRIFWSFDDTFIAISPANSRTESTMVRNCIAIMHGKDPLTAQMEFHWGRNANGSPASFFPEDGDSWYWTGDALRLDEGPLVVFLWRIVGTPGEGLGFQPQGYAIAVIDNPDSPPAQWRHVIHPAMPPAFGAFPGTTLIRDGAFIIAVAIRQKGVHAGGLARYRSSDLARGDLSRTQWWAGEVRGWVAQEELGTSGPEFVIDDAGAENSIHFDERIGAWVHIATYGFGRAWIGMRTAPELTGPWSPALQVYRPPESDWPHPFVYAAMAHPDLATPNPGELFVTYATNALDFDDLFTEFGQENIYWPRVITVDVDKAGKSVPPPE